MFALKPSELDVFWLRYLLTASDFHLPIVLMSSTAMPAATAELAAPRRKEWPEYVVGSYPARRRELVMLSASQRLLNALAVRVNNGSVFGRGNLWNNVFSARTGQELSFAGDKGIVVPSLYWSVLDFGKFRRTPSLVNSTDCRETRVSGEVFGFQDSHVNSDGRRNAANATQKAVWRLRSLKVVESKVAIAASRMSLVISARFRTGLVPWILRAPRKMREIRGSLNTSIEMPFSIWTLWRAAVYCLTVSGLLNSTCSAIQLARTGNVTGIA